MLKAISKVLVTKEEIEKRIEEIASEISNDYQGKDVLVVCVLRGAVLFFADLVRKLKINVKLDFMAVSSYGSETKSSGEVKIVKDLSQPIEGVDVILVEDIVDSGHTIRYLKNLLGARNPSSVKVAALLDKPERREVDITADYLGFTIPNEYVVGYGLDYQEYYRTIDEVCVLKPEVYESEDK